MDGLARAVAVRAGMRLSTVRAIVAEIPDAIRIGLATDKQVRCDGFGTWRVAPGYSRRWDPQRRRFLRGRGRRRVLFRAGAWLMATVAGGRG
jgi:nucleoid DNA-binding protein